MLAHSSDSFAGRLTDRALIAFCTAAIDHIAGRSEDPAVSKWVTALLDELWAWQHRPLLPPLGEPAWSNALYDRYTSALLEKANGCPKESPTYRVIGAAYTLLLVILGWMNALEYRTDPARGTGAPADVVEADWDTLAEGLDWACKAAEHPEAEHQWQLATFARLLAVQPRHPPGSDAPHKDGSPIRRDWFFP